MNARTIASAFAAAFILAAPAVAQDMKMPAHGNHMPAAAATTPSTAAFEAANAKMHADMAIDYTGRPDVDFVRSMIPHHEGAIAMARIELEHGKDPQIRKIAEEVIKAQEAEIAMMKDWLAKNGE
ncbi:DUF305 domain-containing protein [Rhizobium sp. 0TCS1.26]|uniref:CopM family metallochaperone n=1 Tax=Rhizobium sp. 0TCS1.26 TaxID=3142623 RepID=UPI003D2E4831